MDDEKPQSSIKSVHMWLDGETKMLFNLYAKYVTEVGPMKQFLRKKDMWSKISSEIYGKTAKQCEERYKTVMKRKRNASGIKNQSSSNTQSNDFKQEIYEITAMDDSIESEVPMTSQQCIKEEIMEEEFTDNSQINNDTVQSTMMEIAKIKEEGKERRHRALAEIAMQREANRERRHRDRMKAANKFYCLLEKLIDQNTKTD